MKIGNINLFQNINNEDIPNQRLMKALKESDIIMEELEKGKRQGYIDTDSLFEALDK